MATTQEHTIAATFSPETLQAIERAFLESQEKYKADIEKSGQAPNSNHDEQLWENEMKEVRERKKARCADQLWSEKSRQSISRIIRKELAKENVEDDQEAPKPDAAAEVANSEAPNNHISGPKISGSLPEAPAILPVLEHESLEHKRVFSEVTIKSLMLERDLITVKEDLSLRKALNVMAENDISSVPVIGKRLLSENKVIGVLDIVDVVRAVIEDLRDDSITRGLDDFLDHATAGTVTKMPWAKKNFVPLRENDKMYRLLQLFGFGVHRVAIVNDHKRLCGIVSQKNIIHLFARHNELAGNRAEMKIDDLNIMVPRSEIITVTAGTPAWLALHTISVNHVSGIAVVSNDGKKLIGEISAQSMKGLRNARMHLLLSPISELLQTATYGMKLAFLASDATLSQAIDQLVLTKRERVWIVKPGTKDELVGLVTMSEIARVLVAIREDDTIPTLESLDEDVAEATTEGAANEEAVTKEAEATTEKADESATTD